MYKALVSFTMNKNVYEEVDVKKGEILAEDFASQEVINDLLNAGYIAEYDGSIEITENGTYDVTEYESADVNVSSTPVSLQSKEVTITNNTTTTVTADSGYGGLSDVSVTTNVQPTLQNKQVTITENTTTTVQADNNYDGLGVVEVTTNVSGADLSEYFNTTVNSYANTGTIGGGLYDIIQKKIPAITIGNNITSLSAAFYYCSVEAIENITFNNNVTDLSATFKENRNLIAIGLNNGDTTNVTSMYEMFYDCIALISLDLSNWETPNLTDTTRMFANCVSLTHIDIRKMTFDSVTSSGYMFGGSASGGVPDNCEIIVKSQTEKEWITSKFSRLTNVKTVAEL